MEASYSPVQYVYREIIEEEIMKQSQGKIFYFCDDNAVGSVEGVIVKMEEISGRGLFITMDSDAHIRIDRIITLFGKPGAAFDEYDAYGNTCLDCKGGYDL
jgi:NADPH-dependent glutamate synthase beta subunit-like oxidoreductase